MIIDGKLQMKGKIIKLNVKKELLLLSFSLCLQSEREGASPGVDLLLEEDVVLYLIS